jgi:hypothetical protein
LSDLFYTKPKIAKACLGFLNKIHPLKDFDLIVEPSAGLGAFVEPLQKMGLRVRAIDIDPSTDYEVGDFLDINLPQGNILTVGNPPFSLLDKFLEKAWEYSRVVAFIMPYRICSEGLVMRLPLDSFIHDSKDALVGCCFYVMDSPVRLNPLLAQRLKFQRAVSRKSLSAPDS